MWLNQRYFRCSSSSSSMSKGNFHWPFIVRFAFQEVNNRYVVARYGSDGPIRGYSVESENRATELERKKKANSVNQLSQPTQSVNQSVSQSVSQLASQPASPASS
ncbi:hypothetical protein M0804_012668 [Polistes exclamans]|nr:hypothetical protein M0804_012668 [Polistes exclamans]